MSNYKKKTTLAQWTDERRRKGQKKGQETKKKINNGASQTKQKYQKIKEAANGCWWVEQYIMGSITYRSNFKGIDDE
jgi:hypothetical protein